MSVKSVGKSKVHSISIIICTFISLQLPYGSIDNFYQGKGLCLIRLTTKILMTVAFVYLATKATLPHYCLQTRITFETRYTNFYFKMSNIYINVSKPYSKLCYVLSYSVYSFNQSTNLYFLCSRRPRSSIYVFV